MFRKFQPFDPVRVQAVPRAPGVYIIYKRDDAPYYVGRSRADIHSRLWKHVNRMGSRKITEALERGLHLDFEFKEMQSAEQAEAILIKELGVLRYGNLRRETRGVIVGAAGSSHNRHARLPHGDGCSPARRGSYPSSLRANRTHWRSSGRAHNGHGYLRGPSRCDRHGLADSLDRQLDGRPHR